MNGLNDDKNEFDDENERIKVYLKIKPSLAGDKIFYNVSKDKKILSLLDDLTLDDQKKTKKIEVDKIFTNRDENSYLYEEVMRNCVKNSLNGDNYTFISYGDSYSEKHSLIIGTPDCYENINNRGIFPRLLESYINKIDSNEILSDTISLNLSYIMINDNNLIDLTQLMGMDKNSLEKLSKDDYLKKYGKEFKIDEKNNINNNSLLKAIKKTPLEKANDSLFFLLQLLNLFYKFEASSNHFLTWSYFIIILYITDNNGKTVSTISFIILPGNEILLHRRARTKSIIGEARRDSISNTFRTNAVECYNAIEDILNNLEIKNEEKDKEKEKEKDNKKNEKTNNQKRQSKIEIKKEIKSKLFNLIGKLSFDINNKSAQYDRKYVIMGSMFGNSGYISNTKDTLHFLTLCKKLSGQKILNANKRQSYIDFNFFKEKLKAKNDQIYDLESKLKTQESKVKELNVLMDNKEENYKALQENYKVQIKSLKEELGFFGDIENLLKKDENSEDYEYAAKIRNLTENNKIKNMKIDELIEQIAQIEIVIQQLRTLLNVKENDFTMLDIVRSAREAREKKKEEMKVRNKTGDKIEDLQKKNKILENKINGIKNEINSKKNIIKALPEIFSNNMNVQKNIEILENNSDSSRLFGNNKNSANDIINRIKTESIKEKNTIINKYENILNQNKNNIKEQDKKLNNITQEFNIIKNKYLDELVTIYKSIINIVNYYRKAFQNNDNIFISKDKFDKILTREEKAINPILLPLLYNELGKIGYGHFQLNNKAVKPKKKVIKSKYYKNIVEDIDIEKENYENEKKKFNYLNKKERNKRINNIFNILFESNNLQVSEDLKLPINKEMIDKKNLIFSKLQKKTDSQLINMDTDELILYCKNNMKKMSEIETFINTYFKGKNKFSNFDPTKERIEEINKKLYLINNDIQTLTNKYKNNTAIFEKGDKLVQNLRNENNILKKKLQEKNKRTNLVSGKSRPINQFNKAKSQLKVQNLYNSILTTTCSNNGGNNNNILIHETNKGFFDTNSTRGTNEKIDFNLTDNNAHFNNIKRPISSVNKINPYFLVADNL